MYLYVEFYLNNLKYHVLNMSIRISLDNEAVSITNNFWEEFQHSYHKKQNTVLYHSLVRNAVLCCILNKFKTYKL